MAAAFTQESVEVTGCRVALKRGGKGRPLLYLHGAGGADRIDPFMDMLAEDFEVLVPEHPGFGASGEPGWLDNMHDLAYFYLDFMEQLGVRDAVLLGASLGGWLALEIAVRDASRIRALSVIGASGIVVPGLRRGDLFLWSGEERLRNLFHDQTIPERLLSMPPSAGMLDTLMKNEHTTARLIWEPRLHDPHLAKWLHRIRVPTQIVWGANDQILEAGYANELAKLIPGARVDIVPECGHLPQAEKPGEFIRLLREFLAARAGYAWPSAAPAGTIPSAPRGVA